LGHKIPQYDVTSQK